MTEDFDKEEALKQEKIWTLEEEISAFGKMVDGLDALSNLITTELMKAASYSMCASEFREKIKEKQKLLEELKA